MKLTKQALRGVIKEVLKEADAPPGEGLGAGERKRVGRGRSVAGARTGQAEFIGSQEVTVAEVDVLEAVVTKLREIAASPGVNLAGGGMISLLERLLKLLERKAGLLVKAEEGEGGEYAEEEGEEKPAAMRDIDMSPEAQGARSAAAKAARAGETEEEAQFRRRR